MEFELNIQVTGAKAKGPNSRYPGLMEVEFHLHPAPPQDWRVIFNEVPPNVSISSSMNPPKVTGSTVLALLRDEEVAGARGVINAWVAAANQAYNRKVAPLLKRAHDDKEREAAETKRRIEEAQTKLDAGIERQEDAA